MYCWGSYVSWGRNQKLACIYDVFVRYIKATYHFLMNKHKWEKCGFSNINGGCKIYSCSCGLNKYK